MCQRLRRCEDWRYGIHTGSIWRRAWRGQYVDCGSMRTCPTYPSISFDWSNMSSTSIRILIISYHILAYYHILYIYIMLPSVTQGICAQHRLECRLKVCRLWLEDSWAMLGLLDRSLAQFAASLLCGLHPFLATGNWDRKFKVSLTHWRFAVLMVQQDARS